MRSRDPLDWPRLLRRVARRALRTAAAAAVLAAFLSNPGMDAHAQTYDSTEYDWQDNPGASKEEVCGAYAIKELVLAAINANNKCGQTGGSWSDPLSMYNYCMSNLTYAEALAGPFQDNNEMQLCLVCRYTEKLYQTEIKRAVQYGCMGVSYSVHDSLKNVSLGVLAADEGAEQYCIGKGWWDSNYGNSTTDAYYYDARHLRDSVEACISKKKRRPLFRLFSAAAPSRAFVSLELMPSPEDAPASPPRIDRRDTTDNTRATKGDGAIYICDGRLRPCRVGSASDAVSEATSGAIIRSSVLWRFHWLPRNRTLAKGTAVNTLALVGNLDVDDAAAASKLNVTPPSCPPGYGFRGDLRTCVANDTPQPAAQICPPGFRLDATSRCAAVNVPVPASNALPVVPSSQTACPQGSVGTPPNCRAPTPCPFGGTPPHCLPPPPCPPGYVGANCGPQAPARCPDGQVGTPPNCRPIAKTLPCPEGTIGPGRPDCRPLPKSGPDTRANPRLPPRDTTPAKCPAGQTGTPPNCRRIILRPPSGAPSGLH